jgi:hypothetical protein
MINIDNIRKTISNIHTLNAISGNRFVIAITGGGFAPVYWLMSQVNASSSILEINCPYDREATLKYVQVPLKDFASDDTATKMATESFRRCKEYIGSDTSKNCFGIGVSSALASSTWKRGDHRCHVVIMTNSGSTHMTLTLNKGTEKEPYRTRTEEDELCGHLIINSIARACGIDCEPFQSFLNRNDILLEWVNINPIYKLLNNNDITSLLYTPNSDFTFTVDINPDVPRNSVILPGSFNPLHSGHISALEAGVASLNKSEPSMNSQGYFELCVTNVDKPSIPIDEIIRRVEQFSKAKFPLLLTKAPLFLDKTKLFPGSSYAIGIDLAIRLLDPKYTENNKDIMINSILDMTKDGTRFFVSPRTYGFAGIPSSFPIKLPAEELLTLEKIIDYVPDELKSYFREITNNTNMDLSSSKLRAKH